mmetsp:Transcript_44583/g.83704  ORF Transcript_44583/g.83704 Transcript_44583/m.83704 type:complete len:92 (-) Transcript_44583:1306-1581(-)
MLRSTIQYQALATSRWAVGELLGKSRRRGLRVPLRSEQAAAEPWIAREVAVPGTASLFRAAVAAEAKRQRAVVPGAAATKSFPGAGRNSWQ